MCKFIKELVLMDFNGSYDFENSDYRQFEPIHLGSNVWLSIQASYAHYCKPRKTIRGDLEDYSHWELALFNQTNFLRVSDVLPEFTSLAELELYRDGTSYPYIPKDLVEELYLSLKKCLQVADKNNILEV